MREIKFRGLCENKWHYGSLIRKINPHKEQEETWCYLIHKGGLIGEIVDDENSIGQYTGLKDKNGIDIYEGDIVEVVDMKRGIVREGERGLIEWRGCEFVCRSLPPDDWDPMSPCFNPMLAPLKVIGNIYENPELLNNP